MTGSFEDMAPSLKIGSVKNEGVYIAHRSPHSSARFLPSSAIAGVISVSWLS